MSDDLHYIDQLFKKAIEGQEESPPPGVWEQIDKRLDKSNVVSITKKYGTLKRIAVALFAFAVALGMYALQITYKNRQIPKPGIATDNYKKTINHTMEDTTDAEERQSSVNRDNHKDSVARNKYDNSISDSIVRMRITNQNAIKPRKTEQYEVSVGSNIQNQATNKNFTITNTVAEKISGIKSSTKKIVAGDNHKNNNKAESDSLYLTATTTLDIPNRPAANQLIVSLLTNAIDSNKLFKLSGFSRTMSIAAIHYPAVQRIRNKGTFSLNLFFSLEQSKNNMSVPNPTLPRERLRDEFQQKEQYGTSFTAGILGSYSLTRNWSFESGLTFSSSSIRIAPKTIYAQHDSQGRIRYRYNSSSGYIDIDPKQGNTPTVGDSVLAPRSKSVLSYIGIPLQLKYAVKIGKLSIAPAIGLSANFLMKGEMTTALPNNMQNNRQKHMQVNGLKPTYFSGITSIGVEYRLNPSFSIGMAPTFRFALSPINKETMVRSYPGSLGIASGLRINF